MRAAGVTLSVTGLPECCGRSSSVADLRGVTDVALVETHGRHLATDAVHDHRLFEADGDACALEYIEGQHEAAREAGTDVNVGVVEVGDAVHHLDAPDVRVVMRRVVQGHIADGDRAVRAD